MRQTRERLCGVQAVFAALLAVPATAETVESLRVTEVNPVGARVEITNISNDIIRFFYPLAICYSGNCNWIVPADSVYGPGESKMYYTPGMSPVAGSVWVQPPGNPPDTDMLILTGVQYGGPHQDLTDLAVQEGVWPDAAAFAPAPEPGESIQLITTEYGEPTAWVSRPPTTDAWFGTGERIFDPLPDQIDAAPVPVAFTTVASGLISPLGLVQPDDGTGRFFIWEQTGEILVLESGSVLPDPLLDLSERIVPLGLFGPRTIDERGLIGVALHPEFAANGRLYTMTSEPVEGDADFVVPTSPEFVYDHDSVVAEWTISIGDPNAVDPATRREILRVRQPQPNHNLNALHFGPDGYLYISSGDGGGLDDQDGAPYIGPQPVLGHGEDGNGQNPDNVHGTILRINVDGTGSANGQYGIPQGNAFTGGGEVPEIFAWGFRNPYAFSFDRATGELWVGDAGQNDIEEVNLVTAGGNYGWRLKEGTFNFDPAGDDRGFVTTIPTAPVPPDAINPVAQYDHDEGLAIIGGYVYRGSAIPGLQGMYICGDYSESFAVPFGKVMALGPDGRFLRLDNPPLGLYLKGFGQDLDGELYIFASGTDGTAGTEGVILKLVEHPGDLWQAR